MALVTLAAWLPYGRAIGLSALAGIALIVAGVIVLNLYTPHP